MADRLNTSLTTFVAPVNNNAIPSFADFWSEDVEMDLADGSMASGPRSSLLGSHRELTDEISTEFVNWYEAQIIELLCDYPGPQHCKKYDIPGDDWIAEMARLQDLAQHIYGSLALPYETPDDLNDKQFDKFTRGQIKALALLAQQLSTSGGRASARLGCLRMARTIICVNKDGLSNEFTAVYEVKGNKAGNREARYQQIKCSERSRKVCNVVSANKLLALDVATGKILQQIARDPDYEAHNKIGHVKSNCKRDEKLQAAHAAATEGGAKKRRRCNGKTPKATVYTPDDAIDYVDPDFFDPNSYKYPNVETEGHTLLEDDAEVNDNDEVGKVQLTMTKTLRKKATPRSKNTSRTVPASIMSPPNNEMPVSAHTNMMPVTACISEMSVPTYNSLYHTKNYSTHGSLSTNTAPQSYDNTLINGQDNNNFFTTGHLANDPYARQTQMHASQYQYPHPIPGFPLTPSTSFGNSQTQMRSNPIDPTSISFGVGFPATSASFNFSADLGLEPDASAFVFNAGGENGASAGDA